MLRSVHWNLSRVRALYYGLGGSVSIDTGLSIMCFGRRPYIELYSVDIYTRLLPLCLWVCDVM